MQNLIIKAIRLWYYVLRKLSLEINKDDVVLEIGPGGKPHFRSNVICDKFQNDNTERGEDPLKKGKAFLVLGDAENLPFKDKSFDYVIASHLLEHLYNPQDFFFEIIRVGKSGYIETPTIISEKIKSIKYHVNFVKADKQKNEIEVIRKTHWSFDQDLSKWWLSIRDKTITGALINYSDHFFLRFFWKKSFTYKIIDHSEFNKDSFIKSDENDVTITEKVAKTKVKYCFTDKVFRRVIVPLIGHFKYPKAAKFDIREKVCCPLCKQDLVFGEIDNYVICKACNVKYKSEQNTLFLREKDAISLSGAVKLAS
ncbi:MAG: methyltransferase domain-containing protein [Desulfobacteraceae bacterium]|jgi:ubiquinone/menaquinone biosynthesis C-methylase UbiE